MICLMNQQVNDLKNYTDEELEIEFKKIVNYYKSKYKQQNNPKSFIF